MRMDQYPDYKNGSSSEEKYFRDHAKVPVVGQYSANGEKLTKNVPIQEFFDGGQVQADWNQSDDTQADYIKNKPDLSDYAKKKDLPEGVPSHTQNDKDKVLTVDNNGDAIWADPPKPASSGIKEISEGIGISVTDKNTVNIDTEDATEGQYLKKTENGVGWSNVFPDVPNDANECPYLLCASGANFIWAPSSAFGGSSAFGSS